ncbi:MAG: hypothetical protein I3J02_09310 [Prevotella sp.]|nr:hypothetical protein [Prevotella sp.]
MKIKKLLYSLASALMLLGLAACSPDSFDLGDKDVTSADLVEGAAFTITHDSNNPNIVYLKSLMSDRYQVCWVHPQGRSLDSEVELDMPFPGTYEVQFGVETRGGVVYSEPVQFTIDNFYAGFVDNELYTMLTGGVGKSKTWIPDNGSYGLASGDLSYADPSTPASLNNFTPNWEPSGNYTDDTGNFSKSTMTFDLINGAHIKTTTVAPDGTSTNDEGTYLIDTDNAQITLTDCQLLHSPNFDKAEDDAGWKNNIRIIALSENQLRLCVLRNPQTSGEGEWWLCFNFVSKDFADNYEAPEVEVYPTMADNWKDYVMPKNDKIITYKLTGFDWYNKDGSAKNVTGVTANNNLEDMTIKMNSGNYTYELTDFDSKTHSGTFTVTDDGVYTFTPALSELNLSSDGRAVFKCNDDGTMRILGFDEASNCDPQTGALSSIVWGSKEFDDQGKFYQYMGYKFEVVRAGAVKTYSALLHFFDVNWATQTSDPVYITDGVDADYTFTLSQPNSSPYGIYLDVVKILEDHPNCDIVIKDIKVDGQSVAFDDATIDRGAGDDGPNAARRYILNPWGATAGDASKYAFTSTIVVTVSVKMDNGTPFIAAAAKASKAKRMRR